MLKGAFLQESGNGKLNEEHLSLCKELGKRGVPVQLFTQKKIDRNQLPISRETLVSGNYDVVMRALKYLKLPLPQNNCYPVALRSFLKRNVRTSKVKNIFSELQNESIRSTFIKPKSDTKKFDGFVLSSAEDLYKLKGASGSTEIYCSSLVDWVSEYRVYVVNNHQVAIKHYQGDASILPDQHLITSAIETLASSSESTAGYGVDFGVLKNGETSLIEWNDGIALGSYQLDDSLYTDLILARWMELTGSKT
jgi:hypothetical protein